MTIPTTTHHEMFGWPRLIKADFDEFVWERKMRVAWASRDALIGELIVNDTNIYPYNSTGARVIWLNDEPLTGNKVSDGGSSGKLGTYDEAIITARYSTKAFWNGTRLYSERRRPFHRQVHLPGTNVFWAGGQSVKEGVLLDDTGTQYELTYYHLTSYPSNWDQGGKTVSGSENILYKGCASDHTVSLTGTTLYTVTLVWIKLSHSWNYSFNPHTNAFAPVYGPTGTELKPHPTGAPVPP